MKRILSLLGILIIAAGMLSSCSKEEEANSDVDIPQKKLVKLVTNNMNSFVYKYDSKGRVFSATIYDENEPSMYYFYSFDNEKIMESMYSRQKNLDESRESILSLELNSDGFLKYKYYPDKSFYEYKYDNEGHLITEILRNIDAAHYITQYEWENGNLVKSSTYKFENPNVETSFTLKYTDDLHPTAIRNKAKINLYNLFSFINYEFSIVGNPSKDLPISVDYGPFEETFEWTMDDDGYPVKMIVHYEDSEYHEGSERFFEFYWE